MPLAVTLDQPSISSSVTLIRNLIGNATKETDLSITFDIDKTKLQNITNLPFQVLSLSVDFLYC